MDCFVVEHVPKNQKKNVHEPGKKSKARKKPHTLSLIDDENVPLTKYRSIKLEKVYTMVQKFFFINEDKFFCILN